MSEIKTGYTHDPEALDPQEQQWANLYHEFSVDDDTKEHIQRHIDNGLKEARQKVLDPQVAEIAEVGASYYRWVLTASRGDTLPEGLVLAEYAHVPDTSNKAGRLEVVVDPNHAASVAGRYGAIEVFEKLAGQHISEALTTKYRAQARNTEQMLRQGQALHDLVASSPLYEYLSLFEQQSSAAAEQKLTAHKQQVRALQVEQDVKQRHGIGLQESFGRGTAAWREYNKLTYNIDEETEHTTKSQDNDPMERLRSQLGRLAEQACKDRGYTFLGLNNSQSNFNRFAFSYDVSKDGQDESLVTTNFGYYADEIASEVADRFIALTGGDDGTPKNLIQGRLYENIIPRLTLSESYEAILRTAALATERQMAGYLDSSAMLQSAHNKEKVFRPLNGMFLTHILKPDAPIYEIPNSPPRLSVQEILQAAGVHEETQPYIISKEQFEALRSDGVATVSRRERALGDKHNRLMLVATADPSLRNLPLSSSRAELQIALDSHQVMPGAVVGYDMVAYDPVKNIGQYAKSEHDPYEPATVPIGSGQREQLRFMYEQWGMQGLVAKIHAVESVNELVNLIRDESDYSFDQTLPRRLAGGSPVPVVDGRPQMQCTGAANLLSYSLNTVFEGSRAGAIEGYVIEADDPKVSGAGHAQVLFAHRGKQYVLDATPVSAEVHVPGQGAERARGNRRQRVASLLQARRDAKQRLPIITEDRLPDEVADAPVVEPKFSSRVEAQAAVIPKTATELRRGLETQLMAALDVQTREQLMKQVSTYSKDDPIRRVMQVAVQSTRQELDVDLPALKQYLELYADPTNATVLKKHKLPTYDRSTLSVLSRYLDDVQRSL